MKQFSNIKLALAPMAGITDKAFREICAELGADITWSEMVSSEGLVRQKIQDNKSLKIAEPFPNEKNYWVQIFGNNLNSMAEAAQIIEKKIQPTGIDINLGCPVPKAQKAGYGACQIGDIPGVTEIIKKIKENTTLPLSLKTRVGLLDPEEILDFAPKLESAGIDQLVVHARTLKEMFSGIPHWEIVSRLNEILNIPVIFNGGIKTPEDAKIYAEKSGSEILMIGRAALGNPWIFRQIKEYFETGKYSNPTEKEFKETILAHALLIEKYFGEKGFVIFRTHLAAYLKNVPNAAHWRAQAVKIGKIKDAEEILKKITF